MHVPLHATLAATSASGEAWFQCRRCGHRQSARVTGMGEGAQSFLNTAGTAQRRAATDAVKDIQRTIRVARCPRCARRNPGATLRWALPHLVVVAAFFAGGIIAGFLPTWLDINMSDRDRDICKWLVPLLCGGTALMIVPLVLWTRWHGIDRRIDWIAPAP